MAYNPNNKKIFSLDYLDTARESYIYFSIPRLLQNLASDKIDIDNEGYRLLNKDIIQMVINYSEKAFQEAWYTMVAFDTHIAKMYEENKIYGKVHSDSAIEINTVFRNKNECKYTAYYTAYAGFKELYATRALNGLIVIRDNLRPYKNYFVDRIK